MNKSTFSQSHPEQAKWKKVLLNWYFSQNFDLISKKLCPALITAIKYGDSLRQQVSQNPAKHGVYIIAF